MCLLAPEFIIQVSELEITGRGVIPNFTIFDVLIVDKYLIEIYDALGFKSHFQKSSNSWWRVTRTWNNQFLYSSLFRITRDKEETILSF